MRQEIELYLGGKSVEFNEPPQILFSYIRTDYTDPTVLRNSYSKTLTIEGTPNNNQIFNSIYHLDKISDYGTFNPAKRMDFQLFSNGDILEQGYAKLDKINKDGKNVTYDITLFGGLGEFLYNLSYDQTAEGSDTSRGGGEDRRLSSLVFYDETEPNKEFDFDITKETVAEAWEALEKGTGATKWQYINFAPAYNGYPEDFDADKVLINTQGSTCPVTWNNNGVSGKTEGFPASITQGETAYRTYNNYAIGELPKEMTEWEMRDLRSYLQRPVMSMKGFIEAISNPVNNGGYSVELDNRFFSDDNVWYSKAWVTLPQLKKDEVETGQSAKTEVANNILAVSSELGQDYDMRYYLSGLSAGAVYKGIDLTFSFNTVMSGMPDEVYTTVYDYNLGTWGRDAGYFSSIFVQLVGEDENGVAIAGSPIYNFTSPYGDEKEWWFVGLGKAKDPTKRTSREEFKDVYTPSFETNDIDMLGCFRKTSGNNYVWENKDGSQTAFTASLTDKLEYHRVYFRVTKCFRWRDYKKSGKADLNCFEEQIFSGMTDTETKRRSILGGYVNRRLRRCGFGSIGSFTTNTITAATAVTQTQVVGSQVKYTVVSDVVRSGDHISKGDLLNFDGTPCDYLLSYCKLFNLYLSKDTYEKKIYIRTRDTFYNGGTIDLDRFIDRSKEIKVSPLAMDSRWYDFAYPEDEKGGAAEDYDFNYGVEYGKNKVQTTYEFDSAAKNLFEDNIYQNAVQVQESSKYYTLRTVPTRVGPHSPMRTVPTFLYTSVDYKLFADPNDTLSSCALIPQSGYSQSGYTSADGKEDWLPKLQLNNANDPIDGTNILCFYGGFKTSPNINGQQAIYYLTDDLAEMYVVNGETPCWLWTKSEYNGSQKIAKGMTKLPVFSRMLYNDAGDRIDYTWDFGRVRDTYVPVKAYNDRSTIYERWWSKYIADLYDANTRVVEAYVKMEGKVVGDWLRAMYWWDNCYWVLTEINDYNITSYDTTRCKFVKVNDISNYTDGITPPAASTPTATLVPAKYMINASGETITAVVKTSDGGAWHLEYPSYVHPSQVAGTGDTTITLRFDSNPNPDGRDFDIRAYRTVGTSTHFWQEGTESTDKGLSLTGNRLIFDYRAQSFNGITINYRNRGQDTVNLTDDADWVSVSPLYWNGENAPVTINLEANTGSTIRSATIVVSAVTGGVSSNITIDQLPETITITNNGGSKTVSTINSASVSALNSYWAAIRTSGNSVTFSANANTGETTRYEDVRFTVTGGEITTAADTQLVQAGGGGSLQVSPTAITADYSGGDKIMTVNSTSPWSATSKPGWVTLSQSQGPEGQSTVIVTFAGNEADSARTGSITITDGTRTATVSLTQSAKVVRNYLTATPSSVEYDYVGGNKYININSSSDWEVVSFPEWITLSQASGASGNTILGVSASTNWSTESGRTGTIVLRNGGKTLSIPVSQEKKIIQRRINVTPSSLYFDFTGNTKYISVSSEDNNWSLVSKPDWIVLSQTTGETGTSLVSVTAPANTGATTKTGEIIFTDGNFNVSVAVGQPASSDTKTLSVSPTQLYVENSGGTPIVHISYGNRNGDDVTVTSSADWCHPSFVQWTGDTGNLVLAIDNYGRNDERVATVTITSVLDPTLTTTLTVRQKSLPFISLYPSWIDFEQTGGTESLILRSNTNWIIDITDTTNNG